MNEYRVVWQACPHIQHSKKILFVEAENAHDAELIARNHIERKFAVAWFTIHSLIESPALPLGRVKE